MEAYLICGLSCSGQTSVGFELKRRGFNVIDTDEVFGYWGDLRTDKPVKLPDLNILTEDWFNYNGWLWNRIKVEDAIKSNKNIIFFCGSSDKDPEYFHHFKKIFRLSVDPDTLKKRLKARNYSLHNSQLYIKRQLKFLKNEQKYAQSYNMHLINTSQYSIEEVVDIILKYIDSFEVSNFNSNSFELHRLIKANIYKVEVIITSIIMLPLIKLVLKRIKTAIKTLSKNNMPFLVKKYFKKPLTGNVNYGDLRRLTPISRQFGYDRGVPIDRFYIERFLANYAQDICGHVLEIKDSTYTKMFGGDKVTHVDVLHNIEGNPEATILKDLTKADHIQSETFDCIILTQTLHIIYDMRAALSNLYRVLKLGGVLLATFPGISQVVKGAGDNDYNWAFTSQSAQLLFEEYFGRSNIHVESHGNVLAAIAFLHGIAQEELTKEELLYQDNEYQVTITVKAVKIV